VLLVALKDEEEEDEKEEEEADDEEEGNSGAELKEIDIIAGAWGRLGVCLSSLSLFARRSQQFLKVPLAARKRSGERGLAFVCVTCALALLMLVCSFLLVSVYTLPVYTLCTHTLGTCCESCDT
jgi:uncharacterized membrane protein YdbT with pleckstrin-like domain